MECNLVQCNVLPSQAPQPTCYWQLRNLAICPDVWVALPNQLNQMQLVLRPVGNHLKLSDEIKLSATEFGSSGQHSGSLRPESNHWMLPVASCELHMLSIAIVIAATTIPNSDDQWTTQCTLSHFDNQWMLPFDCQLHMLCIASYDSAIK